MDVAGIGGSGDDTKGKLGEPANLDNDNYPFVIYRGLGYKRAGGIGISVFYPAGQDFDPAILDTMTGTGLTGFDKDESVQSFTKFVKALTNLQKERIQEKTDTTSTDRSSIDGWEISLSKTSMVFNGKVQKPSIKSIGGKALKEGTDYSVNYSPSSPRKVGRYIITITGKGRYTGKTRALFKIVSRGTSVKELLKTKKTITVKWKKQSAKMAGTRITGYQIQIATNKKFTRNKKAVTVKGYKKVSKRIRIPGAGKKYFIRIRTFKIIGRQKYYSPWSKTKTLKTKK